MWRSQARKKNALAFPPAPSRDSYSRPPRLARLFSQRNYYIKHQTHPAPPLAGVFVAPAEAGRAGRWSRRRRRQWWWCGSTTAPATAAAWRRWSARARSGPAAAARCASSPTSSATRSAAFATRRPPSCWYVYVLRALLLTWWLRRGQAAGPARCRRRAAGLARPSQPTTCPPPRAPMPPAPLVSFRLVSFRRFVSFPRSRPGPARRGSRIDRRNPTY